MASKRQQSLRETRVMIGAPFASSDKQNNRQGMIYPESSQEKRRHPFTRKRKTTSKKPLITGNRELCWLLLLKMLLSCPKRSITHFHGSWCPCGHDLFLRDVAYFSRFYIFYVKYHPLLCLAEASRLGHLFRKLVCCA